MQLLINKCLRRIFNVCWPERITNEELMRRANENPIGDAIKKRKFGLIINNINPQAP